MRLLLDTHIAYWLAVERPALSGKELATLTEADNEILVSAVAIWELRLKWNSFHVSGTRKGPGDPTPVLGALKRMGLDILPLDAETAATPLIVPLAHKDPFDELLLVQAQRTGARLLTRDRALLEHPLAYQSL
ncbi:type II toxin-antitoxin system VapC family toxin [Sphingomonas sp. 35-24ZXX]|uniref:type II toxin-antitoxin system VapC family toxin n=1 Tax=Sphingomonas sp. 35-24ZXX TaxID=1545915 RepID=UPI00053BFED6|nr:type II toxin-antitoxin system VapC family toxin [Sphingomonas sp. 35-24ZXX]